MQRTLDLIRTGLAIKTDDMDDISLTGCFSKPGASYYALLSPSKDVCLIASRRLHDLPFIPIQTRKEDCSTSWPRTGSPDISSTLPTHLYSGKGKQHN